MAAALICFLGMVSAPAWALHFDVELRTSLGPVAGSKITTHLFGDLNVTGPPQFDAQTGFRIFWGYFGDLEGGPYLTDDPGFQAFSRTFLRREEIHFRAVGTLLYWNPDTGRWGPAAPGTKLALFGGIPIEVIVGHTENPALWQAQYDYWAAGSRFTAQGVEGPPTAVIDDAGSSGSFHAHLDWKITAAGASVPAAGAYLVTLELFSTALHNGAPKYLPAEPIHIIFERGITEAQLQAAIQARVTPPPPPRCGAASLSWVVAGTGCSAAVDTTDSGATITARDLIEPALGSAQFTCQAGQWGSASQATCALPPPPLPCTTQTLAWQVAGLSCSASAQGGSSGSTATAVDAIGPQVGSAVFACTNGNWGTAQAATCSTLPPAGCGSAVLAWTQSGQSCNAAVPATASGGMVRAVDGEAPATGSAQFSCSNGTWGSPTAATCAVPPPPPLPPPCAQTQLAWRVGANSCQAMAPATASGLTVALADTVEPQLGSASFTCTAGQWGAPALAVCAAQPPPPPRACTAQTLDWQVAGLSCRASVQGTASGSSVAAVDADGPQVGSAVFACTDGGWGAAQAATCTVPPPPCPAQALTWSQNSVQCTAPAPALESGASLALSDTLAPALGTARFSCVGGRWGAPEAASCAIPPPRDCASQSLAWSVGTQLCQAAAPASAAGRVVLLQDLSAPIYGSARFTCSDGQWLPALQPEPQCGALTQTPSRKLPSSPWRPPPALPWQGP